jgi:hypothetical protein
MSKQDNRTAVLDSAHIGDIRGALGTIRHNDTDARHGWMAKFKTLLAILGPGLIVMVGTTTPVPSAPMPRPDKTTAPRCCGRWHC